MSTLYNNERAYCFLSGAEKAELEVAQKEGRVVFLAGLGWKQKGARGPMVSESIYRITKPVLTKPSIDWDHVDDWVTCMTITPTGVPVHWEHPPSAGEHGWYDGGKCSSAKSFKSFRPGTCFWKDSLVMRPEVGK